jgi:hypothetical protein
MCLGSSCGAQSQTTFKPQRWAYSLQNSAYEPALVDAIHEIVTHEGSDEMRRVGDRAF